jgi:glutamyl/glutaminyl-tRNA synthetase
LNKVFRIAPTPSGYLHIGNAMSFVYTAQLARAASAALLLRIDDMDRERVRPEYVQDIFDTLRFLNITPTGGPANAAALDTLYTQQLRMPLYTTALQQLATTGLVYACTCSRKTLDVNEGHCVCGGPGAGLTNAGVAWRVKVTEGTVVHFEDRIMGRVELDLYATAKNFVIKRKEGIPAYQLSSLCDDVFYGVTDIVRGQDLLTSTAMQLYLAGLLGYTSFTKVVFYHHPLILTPAGEKLSKSAGDISIREMRKHMTQGELLQHLNDLQQQYGLV